LVADVPSANDCFPNNYPTHCCLHPHCEKPIVGQSYSPSWWGFLSTETLLGMSDFFTKNKSSTEVQHLIAPPNLLYQGTGKKKKHVFL
jgi:hypothetical protein